MKINKQKLYYLIPITIGKSASNFIIAIGTVISFLLYAIFNSLFPPLYMNEYLRKSNEAESFGLTLFYFAFIYLISLFYCNPYTGTDEIFAYEYYWQLI